MSALAGDEGFSVRTSPAAPWPAGRAALEHVPWQIAELSKERGSHIVVVAIACMQAMNYDGTNISLITRPEKRPNRGNVTGVLGVSPKGNRFRATLYLRGKQVHLGTYDSIEEAAEARKLGEEKYFKPIIEEFKRIGQTDTEDIK